MSNDPGVTEGQVLAGKYQVERVLGRGGMGFVVAARHIKLNDRVALKFLLPHAASHPDVVARFAREARAAVRIKSEHVARVTDVGELEDGSPYMVMEYLEGVDLADLVQQRGKLPIEDAVEFVLQACEAIAEAHAIGIVHRDLKPANLFLAKRADGSPCVKVLDFGISKMSAIGGGPADAAMTSTQAVMGSPQYMSPEQMVSTKQVDPRADIWALGTILYELLTGNAAFVGETLGHLAILIAQQPPRPMRDARPDLNPGLVAVVMRCLEKDAGRRYQNVGELAVALAEFGPKRARISAERVSRVLIAAGLDSSRLSVPPPSSSAADVAVAPVTRPSTTDVAWGEHTNNGASRSRAPVFVAAALALAAVGGAGVWFSARHSPLAAEPAVTPSSAASAVSTPTTAPAVVPAGMPIAPAASNQAASASLTASAAPPAPAPASPASRQLANARPKPAPAPAPATRAVPATPLPAAPQPAKPAGNFDWGDRP